MAGLSTAFVAVCLLAVAATVLSRPLSHRDSPGFGSAKRAIIIGCDGFGGLYLENATQFLPTFARLYKEGTVTTRARDQMPSVSGPNWCTIVTGIDPVNSGVQNNDWTITDSDPPNVTVELLPPISGRGKIPETQWRVAKTQRPDIKVAVSISWDWINNLIEPGIVDMSFRGYENDSQVAQAMVNFIETQQPELMFVHFDSIDDAGHASYWGSPMYYDAAKNVDAYIGQIMDALQKAGQLDETLIIITSDHGGWRDTHGMFNLACMYIPAIFRGPGITPGFNATDIFISDKDFPSTALFALGLEQGKFMQGRAVTEIFH